MSEISKLERERNAAWDEYQECGQVVAIRKSKLELAEADERAAKARLDDLNAALVKEQEMALDTEYNANSRQTEPICERR